jgi:hypothetical protein
MKQNPASWFIKLLERDFPVRKPRSTALAKRAGMVLQVIGACILGVVLVAFAIAVIDGNPRVGFIENFFFFAAVMIAGVLAITVAIFLMMFVHNAIGQLRRGVKVRFGRVEARRTIELDCDPDEAGRRCRAALRQLPQGCELRPEEAAPGQILAKTSLSMNSAGEIITIGLAAREDGGTRVEIHSCPWFDTTMFDGGINAENVETIARHLQTAPARPASASKQPEASR